MAKTITAANTILTLSIAGLIPAPVQIQGFAADDIFDTETQEVGETLMGVDGNLSAGFVFAPVKFSISLQADSDSNIFFETWYNAEQTAGEKYFASGLAVLPSIGKGYTLNKGVLVSYQPIPSVKKMLSPRSFSIVWESVVGAPV